MNVIRNIKALANEIAPALVKLPPLIIFSKAFRKQLKFLTESQYWSRSEIEEYQLSTLRALLEHAYENVPYYKKLLRKIGIRPQEIDDFSSLKLLPTLDKDTLRKNLPRFIARNINLRHLKVAWTSGTTGKPLQVYWDKDELMKEWAFAIHQFSRVGCTPYDLRIEIRGPPIMSLKGYEYVFLTRALRLCSIIKSKKQVEYYIKLIRKVRAKFLQGHPSAITSLSKIVREYEIDTSTLSIKAILFTSEIVYDWQRKIVEEVFKARTLSHYGQVEHVATAAECEHSRMYHFVPQYGIVEIDPKTKEIIATGFLNWAMPFIRYRTTDVVEGTILWNGKCRCGRNYYPLVERISGRLGDIIVTPQGALIPPTAFTDVVYGKRSVNNMQIVQEKEDLLIIYVEPIPGKSISDTELKRIRYQTRKIVGNEVKIEIEVVPQIERGPTGKFKWVVSKISGRFIR